MLIASFPAGPWETNCYVLAEGPRSDCVIVDPGLGAAAGIADVVAEHHLRPVAVLVTHGHLDHMFAVTPVCAGYEATCWVHPADRPLLADPLAGMGAGTDLLLARLTGGAARFVEPDDVRELSEGTELQLAGLSFSVAHAPGHTPGSVLYHSPGPALVLSGDVVFAGSIGRTDLPGGDPAAMRETLATKVLALPDAVTVLPGHGPQTTIARERATNPYLRALADAVPSAPLTARTSGSGG